jgi:hypothetical protein
MARFSIAYDNEDAPLGHYFASSKEDIAAIILGNSDQHTIKEIPSALCTQNYIDEYFPTINHKNFIFIAYSHGHEGYLKVSDNNYVVSPTNTHNFINSLFYAMTCYSGKVLGPELIVKGCITYIGYKGVANTLERHKKLSIDCDNRALKNFIEGSTAGEAVAEMKLFIKESIRSLLRSKDVISAGGLRQNLAGLVIYGNSNLSFQGFN